MLRSVDKPLLYITIALVIGGFLILASASMVLSQKNFGTPTYYTLRQLLFGIIVGGIFLLMTERIPYRWWKKIALPLMIFSFILLAVLFIPHTSFSWGGATRWLRLGSFSFQPSEVMKLAFIIYLASWLDSRRKNTASISQGLFPFIVMLGIIGIFLIMQPDIGTLGVIVVTAGLLYFLGGGKVSQMVTLSMLGSVLLYFLIQLAPYRLARLTVFLNPGTDPQGIGYQISQALIGIGSGGFWGRGFGQSIQKYDYLPEPIGDSIFAIVAEEMGFLGVVLLISAFGFFFWRGMHIANKTPDIFGKLLAAGITIGITTQTFINMAAISGLMPLTGIPLPFVSYGSTSLVMTLASMGILFNISKQN